MSEADEYADYIARQWEKAAADEMERRYIAYTELRHKIVLILDSYGINDDPEYYPGFTLMVDDLASEIDSAREEEQA